MANANRLGLGTANFGSPYGIQKNPELGRGDDSQTVVDSILAAARECGIGLLDTARNYPSSEKLIAAHLAKTPAFKPLIVSKFSLSNWESDIRESAALLRENLHALLLHNFSGENALPTLPAHLTLGCSTYGIENARAALKVERFKYIEIEFSLLNPHVYEAICEEAAKKGKKLLLRSVFHKGFLSSQGLKANHPLHKDAGKDLVLKKFAVNVSSTLSALGLAPEEAALQYALSATEDAIVLFGANSADEISRNAETAGATPLNASVLKELRKIAMNIAPEILDLRNWHS